MAASLSIVSYFVPIFAFLLVLIVVYAMLAHTKILGSSNAVMLFVSFILASFFIVEVNLVDFVRFSSAWFSVLVICLFFILVVFAFLPWEAPLAFLSRGHWFAYVILAVIIGMFIWTSAHVFHYVINWELIRGWLSSDWFGFVLLLIIAGVVSWTIAK